MTKKVSTATITFHAPINYGAALQAFALQRAIQQELHYNNVIINYQSEMQKKEYSIFKQIESFRFFVRDVLSVAYYSKLKKKKQNFERFIEDKLTTTRELTSIEEVQQVAKQYDVLICGSDQIWNTNLPDYSDAYYLPSLLNKISYGPSLGKKISDKTIEKLKEYVNEFQYLSFREKASVELVKEKYNRDSAQVVDPVFLLTANDWDKQTDEEGEEIIKKHEKGYIFLYSIFYSDGLLEAVSNLSKEMNLPVITAFGSHNITKGIRTQQHGIKVDYCADPIRFIRYIKGSQMVVTDSFHGTAFSVLFHKDFLTFQTLRDGKPIRDERIANLLETVGISGNTLSNEKGIIQYSEDRQYDWDRVDVVTDILRRESLQWLKKSIDETAGSRLLSAKNIPVLSENKSDCCGCGACSLVCPVHAIEMVEDEERFLYPKIDALKCVGCKQCLDVCAFKRDKEVI